jgi:uncharacterized membrane protein YedE/YeeE
MLEELLAGGAVSDAGLSAFGGLAVGLAFGALAQASRFCLRRATIGFWSGRVDEAMAVWLAEFGTALLTTQLLFPLEVLSVGEVRQLASPGTLSGAVLGGLMFGVGMILARGCASRLLVLSATGNARALVTGLVVTVVAQASLTGVLSPLRQTLSGLWMVGPETRAILMDLPGQPGLWGGVAVLIAAAVLAAHLRAGWGRIALAVALGATVSAGWAFTAELSRVSFEPVAVGSVTFTGPSADTLMALITSPSLPLTFAIGLVPGVFLGSFASSVVRREFRVEVFGAETGMLRYLIGGALMGFGGMLAGGCAVGAGVTGGAVLSLTAWVALLFMWIGAGATLAALKRWDAATPAPPPGYRRPA